MHLEIIENEGVESFYKGASASILQAVTECALLYETMKSYVSIQKNGSGGGGQSASSLTIKWRYGGKESK